MSDPLQSVNPATGQVIRQYRPLEAAELQSLISKAGSAYESWRQTPLPQRAGLLRRAAALLCEKKDDLAALISLEMGKPLRESRAEIEKSAWVCEYYADWGPVFLAEEPVATDASRSFVCCEPLGLVLAIMPWNFPFWQVFRFAAPALMAGNGALLKHAPNVQGCAGAVEALLLESGFPSGLLANLPIAVEQVEAVIRHPEVRAVTLTGSERAGRSVARIAADCLKKTVLELGGSDPFVILEDADLELAAETCKNSRLLNAGQSCIGAKRIIAVQSVYAEFLQLFKEKWEAASYGDPFSEGSQIGPMVSQAHRQELHRQVVESIARGANCLLGGYVPEGPGAWYPPTLLTEAAPGMPAWEEELFGPVAVLASAADETEALRMANDTRFGLGAAVFTRDLARGERIAASGLLAGSCFVNGLVKSDPRLPFGGIKASGYGRELSREGLREFVNVKTIWIG